MPNLLPKKSRVNFLGSCENQRNNKCESTFKLYEAAGIGQCQLQRARARTHTHTPPSGRKSNCIWIQFHIVYILYCIVSIPIQILTRITGHLRKAFNIKDKQTKKDLKENRQCRGRKSLSVKQQVSMKSKFREQRGALSSDELDLAHKG